MTKYTDIKELGGRRERHYKDPLYTRISKQ